MRRFLLPALCSLLLALPGCAAQRTAAKTWWNTSGRSNTQATASLLASEAATIAERTVYSKALSAEDALAKNFNVQGFGDGLRELESGLPAAAIGQIPDFVMRLRQIWLPKQTHYTDLAAQLGTTIQTEISRLEQKSGKKLTSDELKQVIEGTIKGLQQQPEVLKGP